MNKKSQFFLIAAVIVCLMIFSVTHVFHNTSSVQTENYFLLYTGIKNACRDTAVYSDNLSEDLTRLEEELTEFCREANISIVLDWEVEGSSVEFYLNLFTPEMTIEDPFTVQLSPRMSMRSEDLLQEMIIVRGNRVKKEEFYRYEMLYAHNDGLIMPDENGVEFWVEGWYKDTIPRIGVFSPIDLAYTPHEIIGGDLTAYDFVIVTDLSRIAYEKADALYGYLTNGGNLLFVGISGKTFVQLLNEKGISVLNMTKNDFYCDNTDLVTIGKGNVLVQRGTKNLVVYGNKAYENEKELTTGTVFFSAVETDYEEILTEMIFTTFKKREQKNIEVEITEDIFLSISDCKGLILEINAEAVVLTSSQYFRTLPPTGEYRLILRSEIVTYDIITITRY
jgi:hypothetical protein